MLSRIVPALIKANVGKDGEVIDWWFPATGQRLRWDQVLHIGDASWSSHEALVYGATPIQPIALGLTVDRDSRKQAGRAARRGRMEMMLSPGAPEVVFNKESTKALVDQYVTAMESGDGIYCVNKNVDATPLSLSAREGEFLGIADRLRAEVLAVFGVPPVRAGEPAANYGTAKQQMRTYWETLQGRAALIDDELSRLAEPGVRIRHSFANVEALQTSQTERQGRVVIWTQLGMTPPDACAYEGFVDAPVPAKLPAPPAAPMAPPGKDPKVDEPREDKAARIATTLVLVAGLLENNPDAESLAKSMLCGALVELGVLPALADAISTEAAALCHEAAALATEPLVDLRAFGADHALRIARLAGVAA